MSAISLGHYLSLGGILFAMSVLGIFLNRATTIMANAVPAPSPERAATAGSAMSRPASTTCG